VPESDVAIPVLRPRIVIFTLLSGFSFSSSTLPETEADFFWAYKNTEEKMQRITKNSLVAGMWFYNENSTGNITEIKLLFWQAVFYEGGFEYF
jgi:hypothetical protein